MFLEGSGFGQENGYQKRGNWNGIRLVIVLCRLPVGIQIR